MQYRPLGKTGLSVSVLSQGGKEAIIGVLGKVAGKSLGLASAPRSTRAST